MDSRKRALIAIILVGMAPTVSVLISFATSGGSLSQVAFILSKLWLFGLPLLWYLRVDGGEISWSKPAKGGYGMAMLLGLGTSSIIVIAWLIFGKWLDTEHLRQSVEPLGLLDSRLYLAVALYWILVNSVLEEYVFRWFIVEKAEIILGGEKGAIILSAAIFVLHHTIAMMYFGFPWWTNLLASLGLFVGGAIFSWQYLKYRSIWIPYITHAICDIAVFGIGYSMLF
ncbi:MAG: type II CAAX endopeptidase family protein [Candidatus Thalassarchaeaceae archaeon]|nr:type II CAAX endopeptidase family protein [Candidatus Thalassarchaeaceae archaeon]